MGLSKDLSLDQISLVISLYTPGYCNKEIHNLKGVSLMNVTAVCQDMSGVVSEVICHYKRYPLVDSSKLTQGQ